MKRNRNKDRCTKNKLKFVAMVNKSYSSKGCKWIETMLQDTGQHFHQNLYENSGKRIIKMDGDSYSIDIYDSTQKLLINLMVAIVCILNPFCWGDWQNQKRGDLTGSQFLEWGCSERGKWLFSGGGWSFYIKNKLKPKIFNQNKSF